MVTKRKAPEDKLKTGRPTSYNLDIAERICAATAITFRGLDHVCRENEGFPDPATVYGWLTVYPEFYQKYMKAKELQQLACIDEMRRVAHDDSNDMIQVDKGWVGNPVAIARAKLKIDDFKWHASKLAPKTYGDKMQQEITVVKHEDVLKELE